MGIYKKLLEIQKHVRGLAKDSKSYGYEYVSPTKLLGYIRPKMDDLGLLLKQEVVGLDNTRQDYETARSNKSEILSKVSMRFTWVDAETGETDVNFFQANGQNDWEKGLGSALTYGERYFLLKYFHIPTDEDDIDNPDRKPKVEPAPAKKKAKPKEKIPTKEQALKAINEAKTLEIAKAKYDKAQDFANLMGDADIEHAYANKCTEFEIQATNEN